jgi:SAM-dependent methyltransferase
MKRSESIWDNSMRQYQSGGFKTYWELLPAVGRYQFRRMTGDEDLHYFWYALNFVRKNIGGEKLKALSLGCSEGNPGIEMRLIESGVFCNVEVMDLAKGLLDKQQAIVSERGLKGIEYISQDLNQVTLEKNSYDLIWTVGTIHHIRNLEDLFIQINDALKSNGVFVMRDYIGPNRLQFTGCQLSIVNEILKILPEKYKRTSDGLIKERMKGPDLAKLMDMDPSESTRSEDIMRVMLEKLEIIKLTYTGGTILHPLLDNIASNFENNEDADTVLKLVILLEEILTENNALPSDYVFCMAKKKFSPEYGQV